jgi:hypothetical protein
VPIVAPPADGKIEPEEREEAQAFFRHSRLDARPVSARPWIVHRRVTLAVVAKLTAVGALATAIGCGGGGGGGGLGGGILGIGGIGGSGLGGGAAIDGGAADVPLDPAPPICGNGIVEAGEACDVAAGCPAGQRCSAICTCVAGPPAPNDSAALIAEALAAGRIDYFTSLLYRASLFVGDGRLPAEYDGDFTVGEDTALFLEVSRLWGTLTAAQQQQLLPYVARPNDPASVYSTPAALPLFGDDGEDLLPAGSSPPIQCPPVAGQPTVPDWRYTGTAHFVVWSCGTGDPTTDDHAGKRQAVAALAEQVWALEVPSMGPPREDDFPFDPDNQKRIDIYLVPLNACIQRGPTGVCAALKSERAIAAAVPDSPCDNSRGALTSSGYILMRLDLVPGAPPAAGAAAVKARSDFAHEFFHLLTYGLNLDAQGGGCRNRIFTGAVAGRTSWLTEASATWAEWAYTPGDNPEYRHDRFSDYQQRVPMSDSLLDNDIFGPGGNPAYEAFTYPLFLSQEAGNRMAFEDFWKTAARGARTREALDDALHGRWSFDRYFRDFAVKMFNDTLPGNPIAPLLGALDMAVPPDLPPVNMLQEIALPAGTIDFPFHVALAPLAAQYQPITVPDTTRWVDVDMTAAGPALTMDAIVNVRGTWERRRPLGARLTFCREDERDDIGELYLVIANTAHAEGARADADYEVKMRVACPGSLTGWFRTERLTTSNHSYSDDTVSDYQRLTETWTLGREGTMDFGGGVSLPTVDAHWSAQFEHHNSLRTALDGPCQSQVTLQTSDGTGSGAHVTPMTVSDLPGGGIILQPASANGGSLNAPITFRAESCDGMVFTDTDDDNKVYESLPAVSTYLQLMPEMGSPGRYRGSRVLLHSETPRMGGSDLVDWVLTWDITRHRR